MSNTIDQRVVEMRFDNKQFESGVSTTLSTLDKLKQKLNLTGASKGLDGINAAAKKVDMTGLGGAVESVSAKFSALQVMGVTALANITNSAVNAGKNIVKALTIDPIKTGFSEYETKMGSIQTILANTEHQGTNLDQVTSALDKLNTYADKTIYNFQQMTKNIGTFTAAGVDLDTSVKSIQGIANLAAVSGSTSQQASTAMYQLSQALASGTVKLMDWNSVVNAGMGGKVFQNALIRTAAVMNDSANDVEAWQKKNIDAHGSFRDSLTQGAWLTTDVLTKTLEQFTMAAEEGSDEWEAFKKSLTSQGYTEKQAEEILKMANTATDAATKVKTFTQLMDTLKESAQSGWAQTWELMIGDFEEAKAFFTNLSDIFGGILGASADRRNTLFGDALNSNWDKLTKTLTDAGVEVSAFEESIKKIVDESKFDKLIEDFGSIEKAAKAGKISSDDMKKAISSLGKETKEAFDFSDMAEKVKGNRFTYALGRSGEEVKKLQTALNELGYDISADGKFGKATYQAVMAFQKAEGIRIDGIIGEETIAALEKATGTTVELTADVDELSKTCDGFIDGMSKKGGRELLLDSLLNIVKAIQRPLEAVGEALRGTFTVSGEQIYKVLEKVEKFTGKFVMKGVLDETTWSGLSKAVTALGISWDEFKEKLTDTLEENGVNVDDLIKKYGSLGKAFEDGAISMEIIKDTLLGFDGVTESLLKGGEAAEKIRRTFAGLFSILKIFTTFAGGAFSIGFRVLQAVLDKFDIGILDFAANVGDAMLKVSEYINGLIDSGVGAIIDWLVPKVSNAAEAFSDFIARLKQTNAVQTFGNVLKKIPDVIDDVGEAFNKALEFISDCVEAFKESIIFQTVAGWIKDASADIQAALSDIMTAADDFSMSNIGQKLIEFGSWISDLAGAVSKSKTFTTIVDAITNTFTKLDSALSKFNFSNFNLGELKNLANWGRKLDAKKSFGSITDFAKGFAGVTLDNFKWNWDDMKTKAITKFTTFWSENASRMAAAFDKGKAAAKALKEFVFRTEQVDLPSILSVVEKFLAIGLLYTALKTIQGLTNPLENITGAFDSIAKAVKWNAISGAFKAMAIALGTLTVCIVVLTSIDDMGKAITAAKLLAQLLVVMGLVIAGLSFVTKFTGGVDLISSIGSVLAIVIALTLLVKVIEKLDTSRLRDPLGTFTELFAMLMVLALGIRIVSKAGSASFGSIAAILTMITALDQILDVIKKYDEYPWESMHEGVEQMVKMLMVLAVAMRVASGGVKAGAGVGGLAFTLIAMLISLHALLDIIEAYGEAVNGQNFEKGKKAVFELLAFMTAMSLALSLSSKTVGKGERVANNFAGLALALLVVVGAIYVLGKMAIDHNDILMKGGQAVGQILLMFTVMLGTIGLACRGLQLSGVVTMIVGIAVIIAELWYIIKDMQSIPWQSALSSAGALALVLGAMATVFTALGKFNGGWKKGTMAMAMMLVLGGVVIALGWLLDQMKDVSWQSAIGNAAGLSILLGAMTGVFYALSGLDMRHFSDSKMKKLFKMFTGLSMVLVLLGITLGVMSALNTSSATSNAFGLSILLSAMAGVLHILSGLDMRHLSDSKMSKIYAMFAGLSGILLLLAVVLAVMSGLNTASAIPNAIALSVLLSVMAGVISILSNSKAMSWKKMGTVLISMTVLAAILYAIAGVIHILNGIDPLQAIGHVSALSVMLLAMSGAMNILSTSKAMSWQKMGTILISMAILSAILYAIAGVIQVLNGVNPLNAIGNVVALSIMLNAMAAALWVISSSKAMSPGQIAGALISMSVLSVLLYVIADILTSLNGIDPLKAIGNVVALSIMLNAMASALLILGFVKHVSIGALAGMAGLVVILTLLLPAMQILNGLVIPIQNAISLGILLNAMAVALFILQAVQVVSAPAILGMAAMAVIVAGLALVLAKVAEIRCESALTTVQALCTMLMTMTAVFVILGLTGSLSATAITGALGLVSVIAILGSVAMAIGGLMSLIPASTIQSWMTGLEYFMEFIVILAEGLGKIASGFIVGFTDGIAEAGENLKSFANSMAGIDPNAVTGMQALCDALNALTGAAFLDNLNDWIFGEGSLSSFGASVSEFAGCITEAASSLANVTDEDAANIKRGAEAAGPLAELANAIPKEGGLWQKIAGESDLSSFGNKIVAFAECLIAYSEVVSSATINEAAIQKSTIAAGYLADLNAQIPASGGVWQQIAGEADLSTWGNKIVAFAQAIVDYSAILATGTINVSAIQNSATAAGHLADLNSKLTADDGVWQKIAGSKDLGSFGESLIAFGDGLVKFSASAAAIDDAAISNITNMGTAVDEVKKVIEKIDPSGGWSAWLLGETDTQGFGTGLTSIANGITDFISTGATITDTTIANITNMGTAIDDINAVLEKLPEGDSSSKAYSLSVAVSNLSSVASSLNAISTAEYTYTGISTLGTAIDTISTMVTDIDAESMAVDFLNLKSAISNASKCATTLSELNDKTYTGIDSFKAALTNLSSADVQSVIDAFSGKADSMAAAVSSLVDSLSAGLSKGASSVKTAATGIVDGASSAVLDKTTSFTAAGSTLGGALAKGIAETKGDITNASKSAASNAASGAKSNYSSMYQAGQYLGDGLVAGINAMQTAAYNAGFELGQAAVQGEKDGQESQSPSKATIKAGKWLGEGLVIGINHMGSSVYRAGEFMGKRAVSAISDTVSHISDAINSDIDAQPTIRPVLDLSDVSDGARSLSGMLDANPTLMANIGTINTMMNRRSQNGANSEVVSAITKLRRDLANMPRESYNINGVTYDDGSNIRGFAEAVVRQARIEGRV